MKHNSTAESYQQKWAESPLVFVESFRFERPLLADSCHLQWFHRIDILLA